MRWPLSQTMYIKQIYLGKLISFALTYSLTREVNYDSTAVKYYHWR